MHLIMVIHLNIWLAEVEDTCAAPVVGILATFEIYYVKSTSINIIYPLIATQKKITQAQKTGASRRNIEPSAFLTHRATAFAAPTAALLGNRGDKAMYNSNGCVIYSKMRKQPDGHQQYF